MNHKDTHQTINIDNGVACIDCQIASEGSLTTNINRDSLRAINGITKQNILNMEVDRIRLLAMVMLNTPNKHETPAILKQNLQLIQDNLRDMQEYANR